VILGLAFVAVTLFAPKGIGGLFDRFQRIAHPTARAHRLAPMTGPCRNRRRGMTALLEVSGISVTFDGFRAINNLSFEIGARSCAPSSGRTVRARPPSWTSSPARPGRTAAGHLRRTLISLLGMNEARIAREGHRPQVPAPHRVRGSDRRGQPDPCAESQPQPVAGAVLAPRPADMARVQALAEEVGLADHLHRKSGELSHGQKQWLEIAMLLAQEPRLLLVDEPAAGMTPAEREQTTTLAWSALPRPAPWWWWNMTWSSSAA
jgi:urea transport system ATP-binding protein